MITPRLYRLVLPALWLILLTGCSACQMQLWVNSDTDDPTIFALRNRHYVHVGETTEFRTTIVPDNTATYVILDIDGRREMLSKVNPGEYAFRKTFDEKWLDHTCNIEVRAFLQNGRSDYFIEGSQVRQLNNPDDPPDQMLCLTRTQIVCYQSRLMIKLWTAAEPDWAKGKLEIFSPDNKVTTLSLGRPDIDGFTVLGRDLSGYYTIFYEPKFNQVRRCGKTKAVFSIPDPKTGSLITREIWIDTP